MLPLRFLVLSLFVLPFFDLLLATIVARRLGGSGAWMWLGATALFGLFWVLGGPGPSRGLDRRRSPPGAAPGVELVGSRLVRVGAGVLLLWPGPLTDLLGAALLVPAFRAWLFRGLLARAFPGVDLSSMKEASYGGGDGADGGPSVGGQPSDADPPEAVGPVRDAEFEILQDDPPRSRDE